MPITHTRWLAASLALVFVIAAATHAAGQVVNLYYKEFRKDGRIYVFNDPGAAERFEKSGETGTGLTRVGVGPGGETVFADNETALELFFFKYNISEKVERPRPPTQRIEWRDGKTRITTDLAYLEVSNRIQLRYNHEFPDDTIKLPGTSEAGDSKGSFRIRRAKMKFEGWFWKQNNLTYELQLNWPDLNTANLGQFLEDANIAWDPAGKGKFRVVLGQFKAPFGRQELTSSGSQSFVDRSLVSNLYSPARQLGVAVSGSVWSNRLEYRAGMFNGNGRTQALNDNDEFMYVGRLMWQPNANQAIAQRAWVSGALYSEADFESTTVPLYAIGVQALKNSLYRTTSTATNNFDVVQFGVDGIFKFKGFCGVGEWYWREQKREAPLASAASTFEQPGWFVQAGQMLNKQRTIEAAFRYGTRDPNDTVDGDDVDEIRGAVSYYYRRHTLKLQADFGKVEQGLGAGKGSRRDNEFRVQAQFIF
ncbi:MAG: porin [Acidobacteria bacterium]|nr:porin [Acidobacteriota bacterium]